MNKTNLPVILGVGFLLFVVVVNTCITYMTFKHPELMLFPNTTPTIT